MSRQNINTGIKVNYKLLIEYNISWWQKIAINILIIVEVKVTDSIGRTLDQAVSRRLPTAAARVECRSSHVGFLVDKVALGHIFSEFLVSPCQISFHRLLRTHHLSTWAVIIGQIMADVSSGLSLTPLQETKEKLKWVLASLIPKAAAPQFWSQQSLIHRPFALKPFLLF
jgi:hypothetical protein